MSTIREIISSAYDRLEEAHWNIHQMEENYHESDPFRFALNSFIRVIKEVPQILQMELQNRDGFKEWYINRRRLTTQDPLISDLFKKRDIVVHKSMLRPKSSAVLGITEGRGFKLGLGLPLDPFQDSDVLIIQYLFLNNEKEGEEDIFGILGSDEESLPCIERHWGLDPFEEGILELAVQAWNTIASLINDTVIWLGEDPSELHLTLKCIHSSAAVSVRTYRRDWIQTINSDIKKGIEFYEAMYKLKVLRHRA
ncbi:hypothetical protein IIE26_05125 [Cytobacillus oceanisediminis]|uniref:hypothetical protein n=1 Tax=Cytobacillus oceanisediminis TaxID=665099 RepID=UPI00186438FC|nr:hypothetical protein [Cytobacillus oceanisediminis]QOK28053.1 hypothetical protein IIE26_05125 [Cytobacillus oceanisediminis]